MLVTSFIVQRDGSLTRPASEYLNHFKRMRENVNSHITLFLDKSLSPSSFEDVRTTVVPISIEELDTFKLIDSCPNTIVNYSDNITKNTKDFHIIVNSKTELMLRAMEMTQDERIAWIDFGISHIIRDDNSFKNLDRVNLLPSEIVIPGFQEIKVNNIDAPAWRFLGGFFCGSRDSITKMHQASQKMISETLPQVTWETSIWSKMEHDWNFPFVWYKATFNDSILNFDSFIKSP